MDIFEEYLSPAALPADSAFHDTDRAPQQQPSQDVFILHEVSPGQGVREMTRQQWETLKPLIKRIYIDEDKPFPYLARILREEHQFEPTKRQFSRQVDKWGFRKNVSSSERRRILQSLAGEKSEAVPELQDRRLKAGKLNNWKRRYREDMSEGSRTADKELESMDVSHTTLGAERGCTAARAEVRFAEAEGRYALQSRVTYITQRPQEELNHSAPRVLEDALPMNTTQDSWPFDWSTVDVPGSPGLSRLFTALEIDSTAHVPQLFLDEPEPDNHSCISLAEIQDISHGRDAVVTQYWSSEVELASTSSHHYPTVRCPQYPWRNIGNVYCGYSTSPLAEIYVFPPPSPSRRSRKYRGIQTLSWTELTTQERELETRFAKLRAHLSEDNPAILIIMENFSGVLTEVGKYKKAEIVQRKLVDIYRRKVGPKNIKVLQLSIHVAELLRVQGRITQARRLIDEIRSAVKELGQPHHQLAVDVAIRAGVIAADHERYEDSERFRREVLQMTLSLYGPRHPRTIEAISELGIALSQQSKRRGDILSRTAVQICLEELDEHDALSCRAMGRLSWVLNKTGASEEGYNVSTKAVEKFNPHYGPKQERILELEAQRAWAMLETGKLVESENLFRDVLSRGIEIKQRNLSNLHCGLVNILFSMGRDEEATAWCEKAFQYRFETYWPTNLALISTCYQLSACYERQGRLVDALQVCQRMIDRIREVDGDNGENVAKLEVEISRVQKKLKQQSTISIDRETEINGNPSVFNNSEHDESLDESITSNSEDDDDEGDKGVDTLGS